MTREPAPARPWALALSGLIALAVAMGIGRFAFTPILPMMQQDSGVSVAQGGWLASANYAGYLIGALLAMRASAHPGLAVRAGLLAIGLTTLAMALDASFAVWLALRLVAGVASALVLVHVSALTTVRLALAGRGELGAVVFVGIGAGIVYAGIACLLLLQRGASSAQAWTVLGVSALAGTVLAWRGIPHSEHAVSARSTEEPRRNTLRPYLRYILCYGAFGIGYIIPATFLPVMARAAIPDPAVFGWAWPAFGTAGMVSTLVAVPLARAFGQRQVWAGANLVMAAGVLVPIGLPGLAGIVVAALCVGGTFMVVTMLGLQEARRLAGPDARALMAAMTSSFAVGQIVGPLLVGGLVRFPGGFSYALAVAAVPLLAAGVVLMRDDKGRRPRRRMPGMVRKEHR
jgi:predicted MFS family arabinose efflux permease